MEWVVWDYLVTEVGGDTLAQLECALRTLGTVGWEVFKIEPPRNRDMPVIIYAKRPLR